MRAIVTVIGSDKAGIIAKVSSALFDLNANVLDISQTVLQEYFAMIMLVDLSRVTVPFDALKAAMDTLGQQVGVDIRIQREEIFNAMHRI